MKNKFYVMFMANTNNVDIISKNLTEIKLSLISSVKVNDDPEMYLITTITKGEDAEKKDIYESFPVYEPTILDYDNKNLILVRISSACMQRYGKNYIQVKKYLKNDLSIFNKDIKVDLIDNGDDDLLQLRNDISESTLWKSKIKFNGITKENIIRYKRICKKMILLGNMQIDRIINILSNIIFVDNFFETCLDITNAEERNINNITRKAMSKEVASRIALDIYYEE